MKVTIQKKALYSQLLISNPYLDEETATEISKMYEKSNSSDQFNKDVVSKYGSKLVESLTSFDMVRNLAYFVTYLNLRTKGYRYLGFNYIKGYEQALSHNSIIAGINISNLDKKPIFEISDLPKDFIGAFFDYKQNLLNEAIEHTFPLHLEEYIEKDTELKSIYKHFHNFPLSDKYKGVKIGRGMDGPLDRLIVGAVTLLNKLNLETLSSCSGHSRYDEAGLEGAVAPHIILNLDDASYKHLLDFTETDPKFQNITIAPFHSRGQTITYKLESGNNLMLEASNSSERAIILSYYLSILNHFTLSFYKSKNQQQE